MTKDVLVSISGLQMAVNEMENSDDEPVEVLSPGTYYFKDGKHYIFMEEVLEGYAKVTKTRIQINENQTVEVTKKGAMNMHMIFEKNEHHTCLYNTMFGQLNLGIYTTDIMLDITEENMNIRVEYAMDVEHEPVADCTIRINVKSRTNKDFSLDEKMTF